MDAASQDAVADPAAAAVVQAAPVVPDAAAVSDAISPDINETLKNAASLAQALHQNPG